MIKVGSFEITIGHFPDGTLSLGDRFNNWNDILAEANDGCALIRWHYQCEEELVALIYIVNHLRSNMLDCLFLSMPYIPNARMDRVKDTKNNVFTLKYFAEIINSLNFKRVFVLDPHSPVSEALINNIEIIDTSGNVETVIKRIKSDKLTIFFPDEGACKRYINIVTAPYAFGVKRRDWKSGEIQGLDVVGDINNIKDHDILIIDDICSRGGTFYHSAQKLKKLGAQKIYIYVTHCENTITETDALGSNLLLDGDLIERVFTTDDIFTGNHSKVEVINK